MSPVFTHVVMSPPLLKCLHGEKGGLGDGNLIGANSTATGPTNPLYQLASLCTFFIACIMYRSAQGEHSSKLLARIKCDRTLPIMAWLFGIGMNQCIRNSSLVRPPLLGDTITLEDAFGRERRIQMAICATVSLVQAFIEARYAQIPGEDFIRRSEFNILFRSRIGVLMRDIHWFRKDLLSPVCGW